MKMVITFPGQGSQRVGMLGGLAAAHRQVEETFAEASQVLGYDLWQLAQAGPESELNSTQRTQPAMLAAGVAVWRVWCASTEVVPEAMAGHSLGEYAALVCAGALSFETAVSLVAERGRLMQEAVPAGQGAIAAVLGLDDQQVAEACHSAGQGEHVSAVNFNAPGQVVIAGQAGAVTRAIELARLAGAKRAIRLPLSVPVHCELMHGAAEQFAAPLDQIRLSRPEPPVLHNVDVEFHDRPDDIRTALREQIYRPVRWTETVHRFISEGAEIFLELGPGKVLTGLARRIDRGVTALSVDDPASLEAALSNLKERT